MPMPEMTNPWESPFLIVPLLLMSIAFVLWAVFRRRSTKLITSSEAAPVARVPDVQRCICGEAATDPGPVLKRSRGDVLRSYFGAPPRYKRAIDLMAPPKYCRSHAHLADVLMDRHIYDLRAEQAATNASIAGKAANYEQEGLDRQIAESLTEDQKKASKRTSNVTRLVSSG